MMPLLPIEPAEIIAAARAATGLTEVGETRFLDGLQAFVASINHDARLSPAGRAAMVERLVRIVKNRLRFTADLLAHPEILDEILIAPVVILGLPRVGSTKFHRMLGASGSLQEMLFWQVFNPARIAGGDDDDDPRIAEAQHYVDWRSSTNPAANAAHRIAVNEVEEESFLLEFSFETMYPMAFVAASSYYEWIGTRDRFYTYDYLARLLKYLQWQFYRCAGKPWILKSPPNLGFEAQILAAMPGARFVMLHRDPVTIIASVAALVKQSRLLYGTDVDAKAIGRWCLREFSTAIGRHMTWRRDNPGARIVDFCYRDIDTAPMKMVATAYQFLELPLTAEVTASIEGWLKADQHGAGARHEYALEDCGLSAPEIRAAFADYMVMFKDYLD